MENLLKIGISQGDINGISIEVILKTLSDTYLLEKCIPVIYGSPKSFGFYKKLLNLNNINLNVVNKIEDVHAHHINIIPCGNDETKVEVGLPTQEAGKAAFDALQAATDDLVNGKIDALVTAPINKQTIHSKEFKFIGHTEYLESRAGNNKSLMILTCENLRVALVTTHVPVSKIASEITEEKIIEKIEILNQSLINDFNIFKPRIAVLGLNPHSGDQGLIGNEEETIIKPALTKCSEKGILCVGPLAADGFFGSAAYKHYDAVLAMYHDQGLTAFKAMCMNNGVNFTAGLPFVRTSPDHGTAYDVAGQGIANEESMREAVFTAIKIVQNRNCNIDIRQNPLPFSLEKQNGRRND